MNEVTFKGELILTLISKQQWIDKVPRHLPDKIDRTEQRVWLDRNGNCLVRGDDFSAAEEKDTYPVKVYRLIRVINSAV